MCTRDGVASLALTQESGWCVIRKDYGLVSDGY